MIRLKVSEQKINLKVHEDKITLHSDLKYENSPYQGEYEITPTEETQTVYIKDKKALGNIIVNPIPNNYGKVTRVGAAITIE